MKLLHSVGQNLNSFGKKPLSEHKTGVGDQLFCTGNKKRISSFSEARTQLPGLSEYAFSTAHTLENSLWHNYFFLTWRKFQCNSFPFNKMHFRTMKVLQNVLFVSTSSQGRSTAHRGTDLRHINVSSHKWKPLGQRCSSEATGSASYCCTVSRRGITQADLNAN